MQRRALVLCTARWLSSEFTIFVQTGTVPRDIDLSNHPDLLAARFFAVVTREAQNLVRKPYDLAL